MIPIVSSVSHGFLLLTIMIPYDTFFTDHSWLPLTASILKDCEVLFSSIDHYCSVIVCNSLIITLIIANDPITSDQC